MPIYSNLGYCHFYPRSPCGERRLARGAARLFLWISIHALLAESDGLFIRVGDALLIFLSTLSLRRATSGTGWGKTLYAISIHALLAESDPLAAACSSRTLNFYPRSPCGERLACQVIGWATRQFLSTLSLRRATGHKVVIFLLVLISIHALLAESDFGLPVFIIANLISIHALLAESDRFYVFICCVGLLFLSTLSLRRATNEGSIKK